MSRYKCQLNKQKDTLYYISILVTQMFDLKIILQKYTFLLVIVHFLKCDINYFKSSAIPNIKKYKYMVYMRDIHTNILIDELMKVKISYDKFSCLFTRCESPVTRNCI